MDQKIEENVRSKLDQPLVADLQSSSDLSHPSKARDNNGEIWKLIISYTVKLFSHIFNHVKFVLDIF